MTAAGRHPCTETYLALKLSSVVGFFEQKLNAMNTTLSLNSCAKTLAGVIAMAVISAGSLGCSRVGHVSSEKLMTIQKGMSDDEVQLRLGKPGGLRVAGDPNSPLHNVLQAHNPSHTGASFMFWFYKVRGDLWCIAFEASMRSDWKVIGIDKVAPDEASDWGKTDIYPEGSYRLP